MRVMDKRTLLTENFLKKVIQGKRVGDFYPFIQGDDAQMEHYISHLVGEIGGLKGLLYEADFDHYGSGFASYVSVFLWKKEEEEVLANGEVSMKGLWLYISRLAPVVIMGKGEMTRHGSSGSSDFLASHTVCEWPSETWSKQIWAIKKIVEAYHYVILTKADVDQYLDFQIDIPTILSEPPYKVFDAHFYWED